MEKNITLQQSDIRVINAKQVQTCARARGDYGSDSALPAYAACFRYVRIPYIRLAACASRRVRLDAVGGTEVQRIDR